MHLVPDVPMDEGYIWMLCFPENYGIFCLSQKVFRYERQKRGYASSLRKLDILAFSGKDTATNDFGDLFDLLDDLLTQEFFFLESGNFKKALVHIFQRFPC